MTKILVVEDESDIRELLVDTLVDNGYEVLEAVDGLAGFQQALEYTPDIILLDVMMPGMDGFQTLEKLKQNPKTESIPVIMVSAKGQEQDVQNAINAGAWGYVTKPWDPDELEVAVSNATASLAKSVST